MLDNDMLTKSWRRLISGPQPEVAFARGSASMDETAVLVFKSDRRNDEWKKYQPAIQGLMDQMGSGDLSWEDSAAAFDALGREHDLPRWHYERHPSMEGSGK